MSRLRSTCLLVAMLGFLPVIATAQNTAPTPCSTCTVTRVPEPATIALLASGAGVVALLRARTKKKK